MKKIVTTLALLICSGFAVASATDPAPSITVTGTTLVPAANATRLEDLHVHYVLDGDPATLASGAAPIPAGNPNIVHSGATSNTFMDVAPGPHKVTVILGLSNHVAVQPPVAPSVSFTVGAPGQLPRTGDASSPATLLLLAGAIGVILGIAMRGSGRSALGLRR